MTSPQQCVGSASAVRRDAGSGECVGSVPPYGEPTHPTTTPDTPENSRCVDAEPTHPETAADRGLLSQRYTLEEFLNLPDEPADWGPWRLYPPTLVLVLVGTIHRPDGTTLEYERYEVDLERCLTSAEVLDWICQVAGKGYADDAVLAGLVRALDDILHPQAFLCSFGEARTITEARVARRVQQAAERWPELLYRGDDE